VCSSDLDEYVPDHVVIVSGAPMTEIIPWAWPRVKNAPKPKSGGRSDDDEDGDDE
jgi:hypothetical protein